MIDVSGLQKMAKSTQQSFISQKKLIARVLKGDTVKCEHCGQKLIATLPEQGQTSGVRCAKGCTDIALEFG